METNKLVAGIVAAAIAVIVLAGVLMPALDNATAVSDKFTNQGRYYIDTDIDADVTITMLFDNDNGNRKWYIDGVLLEYDIISGPEYVAAPSVVGSDNIVFRTDGRARGIITSTGSTDYTLNVTSSSITDGNNSSNAPLFVASTTKTDNVMRYSPDTDVYLVGTSEIIGCGYTDLNIGGDQKSSTVISLTGNIKDGVAISTYNLNNYTFDISNVQINTETVSGYKDLYKFSSITFDATETVSGAVTNCTYSMIMIPAEITAEKAQHLEPAMNTILSVIPIIIIVAVLLGVVAIFMIRRE